MISRLNVEGAPQSNVSNLLIPIKYIIPKV